MRVCLDINQNIGELAGLPPEELSPRVREHLVGCPACARALEAARLTRGLMAATASGPEPLADFARRVAAAAPAGPPPFPAEAPDLWRPAWGLLPAFAATAAALLILFQASPAPVPGGLLPAENLSAGERLVLDAPPPDPDLVLAAVLEGGGQ